MAVTQVAVEQTTTTAQAAVVNLPTAADGVANGDVLWAGVGTDALGGPGPTGPASPAYASAWVDFGTVVNGAIARYKWLYAIVTDAASIPSTDTFDLGGNRQAGWQVRAIRGGDMGALLTPTTANAGTGSAAFAAITTTADNTMVLSGVGNDNGQGDVTITTPGSYTSVLANEGTNGWGASGFLIQATAGTVAQQDLGTDSTRWASVTVGIPPAAPSSVEIALVTATENDDGSPLALEPSGSAALPLVTALEDDSASPLALAVDETVTLTLAAASEDDTASPLSLSPSGSAAMALASASEDDTASPLSLVPSGSVDLEWEPGLEDNYGNPLSLVPAGVATLELATANEDDTAEPLSLRSGVTLVLAEAAEDDTASPLALTPSGAAPLVLVTANEDDDANPLGLVVETPGTIALVSAAEDDTANPLSLVASGSATLTLATAWEDDLGNPLLLSFPTLVTNALQVAVYDPDTWVTVRDNTAVAVRER